MTLHRIDRAGTRATETRAGTQPEATVTSISDVRKDALVDEFVRCYFDAMVVDDALPESLERLVMGLR